MCENHLSQDSFNTDSIIDVEILDESRAHSKVILEIIEKIPQNKRGLGIE